MKIAIAIADDDAERPDNRQRLERERIHLLLLDEVGKGLADAAADRSRDARDVIAELNERQRRT